MKRWRDWYAPARQPFRVDGLAPQLAAQVPLHEGAATPEWRDTFFLYGGAWSWLTEEGCRELPPDVRRSLQSRRRAGMRPKPSLVWPVRRLVHSWTFPGTRLSRRLLVP